MSAMAEGYRTRVRFSKCSTVIGFSITQFVGEIDDEVDCSAQLQDVQVHPMFEQPIPHRLGV